MNKKAKFFLNPFLMYVIMFSVVVLLYLLPWSQYYPILSLSMILFILCTFVPQITLYHGTRKLFPFVWEPIAGEPKLRVIILIAFLLLLLNVWYVGQMPLLAGISGSYEQSVKEIGLMPVIYPLSSVFFFCYGCHFFYCYLSNGRRVYLTLFFLFLSFHLTFLQRGVLFSQIATVGILYLMRSGGVDLRRIVFGLGAAAVLFAAFGAIGSLRDSGGEHYRPITEIGGATQEFRETGLPDSVFYVWLYMTSPLANFQVNVDKNESYGNDGALSSFILLEVMPDVLSKRIAHVDQIEKSFIDYRIVQTLNVGTMYSRSYSYIGWLGCFLIYIVYLAFSIFYTRRLVALRRRGSPYTMFGASYFLVFSMLSIFDNMIPNSARFLPLLFPLLMDLLARTTCRSRAAIMGRDRL